MKSSLKRLTSLLCVLSLVLGMLPMHTRAEEEIAENPAVEIVPEESEVCLYTGAGDSHSTATILVEATCGDYAEGELAFEVSADAAGLTATLEKLEPEEEPAEGGEEEPILPRTERYALTITAEDGITAETAEITLSAFEATSAEEGAETGEGEPEERQPVASAAIQVTISPAVTLSLGTSALEFMMGSVESKSLTVAIVNPLELPLTLTAEITGDICFTAEIADDTITVTPDDTMTIASAATLTIKAKDELDNEVASCSLNVSVTPRNSSLTLDKDELHFMGPGDEKQVEITVSDPDGQVSEIVVEMSPSVAPFDRVVTLDAESGTYTLTITALAGATYATNPSTYVVAKDAEGKELARKYIQISIEALPPAITVGAVPTIYADMPNDVEIELTVVDQNVQILEIQSVTAVSDDELIATARVEKTDGGYALVLTPKGAGIVNVTIRAATSKASAEKTVQITVTAPQSTPEFDLPGTDYQVLEDGEFTLSLADIITSSEITYDGIEIESCAHGTAIIENNVLKFNPDANHYSLADDAESYGEVKLKMTYTKFDTQRTVTATVSIFVTPVEDAPVAADDTAAGTADGEIKVKVRELLGNDSTVELAGLAFAGLVADTTVHNAPDYNTGSFRVVTEDEEQYIVYTPNIRYVGEVSVDYEIKNKEGTLTDTATLTIDVSRGANKPAVITAPAVLQAVEDTACTFTFDVKDLDIMNWDSAQLSIASNNEKMLLNNNTNIAITRTSAAGDDAAYSVTLTFEDDAYTSIRYGNLKLTVTFVDDFGGESTLEIPVAITGVDDASSLTVNTTSAAGTQKTATLTEASGSYLLAMHEDDTATFTFTLTDRDLPLDADGAVDLSQYVITLLHDDTGEKVFSTSGITHAQFNVNEDKTEITYIVTFKPKSNANTHQTAFLTGNVALTLTIEDKTVESALLHSAAFEVDVAQVNDAPKAAADKDTTVKDVKKMIDVLKNDEDVDGLDTLKIRFGIDNGEDIKEAATEHGGTVKVVPCEGAALPQLEYTPPLHYHGVDTFEYFIVDNEGVESKSLVTVTVTFKNYPPVITLADAEYEFKNGRYIYTVSEDSQEPLNISFDVYDDITAPDSFKVIQVVDANGGLISTPRLDLNGTDGKRTAHYQLQVTPSANKNSYKENGENLIEITISASDQTEITKQKVYINIKPQNDAPNASNKTLSYSEGSDIEGNEYRCEDVLSAVIDVDAAKNNADTYEGDEVFLVGLEAMDASKGRVEITKTQATALDGTEFDYITGFTYYPKDFYFAETVTLSYTVRDKAGLTATATLTFSASKKDDAPVFELENINGATDTHNGRLHAQINEDGELSFDIFFKDAETSRQDLIISVNSDKETIINRQSLSIPELHNPDDSMTNITGGAKITIKPRANQFTEDGAPVLITISVSDGNHSVSQSFYLTVISVPDNPIVPPIELHTNESAQLEADLSEYYYDVDPGDSLTLTAIELTGGTAFDGSIVAAGNANIPGTLSHNENGTISFIPETGFSGSLTFQYTVKDSTNLTSNGELTILVGAAVTGPSIRRIPPVAAYAGQKLEPFTLETMNVPTGTSYTLTAEIHRGSVVETVKIQDAAGSYTASEDNPTHKLELTLSKTSIGQSVIRVTIESGEGDAKTKNTMSFTVTTHAENQAPTMLRSVTASESASEREDYIIDVIDLAEITDLENEVLTFGNFTVKVNGNNSNDRVEARYSEELGRYVLVYNTSSHGDRKKGDYPVVIEYEVHDAGGESGIAVNENGDYVDADGAVQSDPSCYKGKVSFTLKALNHRPYSWDFYEVGSLESGSITILRERWDSYAHDVDGDVQYLQDVRLVAADAANGTVTTSPNAGGSHNIVFTPDASFNEGGWITIEYKVVSYADCTTYTADTSGITADEASGYSRIYLYVPPTTGGTPGKIPIRLSGLTRYFTEDSTVANSVEYNSEDGYFYVDVTNQIFATEDDTVGFDLDIRIESIADSAGAAEKKLSDVEALRKDDSGKWRYYIKFKIPENGNSYLDKDGNMTDSEVNAYIRFAVRYKGSTEEKDFVAANLHIEISALNDDPAFEQSSVSVDYKQTADINAGGTPEEKSASAAYNNQTNKLETAPITMDKGSTATIKFKITDVDFPSWDKCAEQLVVAINSSNGLTVASNLIDIQKPTEEGGFWTAEFKGALVGTTDLTITAYDKHGGSTEVVAVIPVNVQGVNQAPVARDHYAVFNEDTRAVVQVAYQDGEYDSDQDGDPLNIVILTASGALAEYGSVHQPQAGGIEIEFSPNNNFCHQDEMTLTTGKIIDDTTEYQDNDKWIAVRYKLVEDRDGGLSSNEATLYIHFNPVNDAPTFVGAQQTEFINEVNPATAEAGRTQEIALKVRDIDGDKLDSLSLFDVSLSDEPDAVLNAPKVKEVIDNEDGTYTLIISVTPKDYACHQESENSILVVTAEDGKGGRATLNVPVHVIAINDAPVLKSEYQAESGLNLGKNDIIVTLDNQKLQTLEDTAIEIEIAKYFEDYDGDAIQTTAVSNSLHGAAQNSAGRVTFTPAANYCTESAALSEYGSFKFKVTDGSVEVEGTCYIFIVPQNDAPSLKNVTVTTAEDTVYEGTLRCGSGLEVWDIDSYHSFGNLTLSYMGADSTGADAELSGKTTKGGTVTFKRGADGWSYVYTPADDFYGTDTFYYVVSDDGLEGEDIRTSYASVSIQVAAVDDPPRANFEKSANWESGEDIDIGENEMPVWEFDEDTPTSFAYRVWDVENRTSTMSGATAVANPEQGTLTNANVSDVDSLLNKNNILPGSNAKGDTTITMKPSLNAYGDFHLAVVASDGKQSKTYTIPVRILPVNDAPTIAAETTLSTAEDTAFTKSVTLGDVETAVKDLQLTVVSDPARGAVTVKYDAAKGWTYTYTPTANYFGEDSFTLRVTDCGATNTEDENADEKRRPRSAEITMNVTISPVNDKPAAPTNVTIDKDHYNSIEGAHNSVIVTWDEASDIFNETKQAAISYELGYSTGGAVTQFTAIVSGPTYSDGKWTATVKIPSSVTNVDNLKLHVRTADDGKSYNHTGAAASDSVAQTGAALKSDWTASTTAAKVDSTNPSASSAVFETDNLSNALNASTSFTNSEKLVILVTPNAGSVTGFSEIDTVEWKTGANAFALLPLGTTSYTGKYALEITQNGTYTFRVTDKMGNSCEISQSVQILDRVAPSASAAASWSGENPTIESAPKLTITYADSADSSKPGDIVSGLASKAYILVKGDTASNPESSDSRWTSDVTEIPLTAKGSYTLFTKTVDNAGNESIQKLGVYTVDNAAPSVTAQKSAVIYEHTVAAEQKNTQTLSFTEKDVDGDTLTYTPSTLQAGFTVTKGTGNVYLLKQGNVTLAEIEVNGHQLTITHTGDMAALETETVSIDLAVSDGEKSSTAGISLTLKSVNEAPSAPAAPAITSTATHYKSGASIALSWTASQDEETAGSALTYEYTYTEEGDSTKKPVSIVTGSTSASLQAPAAYNGQITLYVRAKDDNAAVRQELNYDGSTGSLYSAWVEIGKVYIDNTAPAGTYTITPDPNDHTKAIVTINPTETTADAWQSGNVTITPPNGATRKEGTTNQFEVTTDGDYTFTITDAAGNTAAVASNAAAPVNPVISYAKIPLSYAATTNSVAVSWTHASDDCTYTLQVTADDGQTWQTISSALTVKQYTFTVPSDFPDTTKMRFRVKAAYANGLYSAWSTEGTIICDSTAPVISFTLTPDAPDAANSIVLGVSLKDATSGITEITQSHFDNTLPTISTPQMEITTSYTVTANGIQVTATATDLCGNTATNSITVSHFDNAAPTVALAASNKDGVVTVNVPAKYQIDFDMTFAEIGVAESETMKYAITEGTARPEETDACWTVTQSETPRESCNEIGTYYVHMYAKDTAGNEVYACFGPYIIMNTAPTAEDIPVTLNEGSAKDVQLDAADKDEGDAVAYYEVLSLPAEGTLYRIDVTGDVRTRTEVVLGTASAISETGLFAYEHSGAEPPAAAPVFNYTATDTHDATSTAAKVTISILPVNDAPVLSTQTPQIVMDIGTTEKLTLEGFDIDDLFTSEHISFSSSDESIIPLQSIKMNKAADAGDANKGEITLDITPVASEVTEQGEPVIITVTIRDPGGLSATVQIEITIIEVPTPPLVSDQSYLVLKGGGVTDSIHASMGLFGTSLSYTFDMSGAIGDSFVGAGNGPYTCADGSFSFDPVTGEFTFTALDTFTNNKVIGIPVTITQTNDFPTDASKATSSAAMMLYLRSEATTFEDIERSSVITVLPSGSKDVTPEQGASAVITSSNAEILNPESCKIIITEDGKLDLVYAQEQYHYGAVSVTIDLGDGKEILVPIVIHPVNNAPDVSVTATPQEKPATTAFIMPRNVPARASLVNIAPFASEFISSDTVSASIGSTQMLTGGFDADDWKDDFVPSTGDMYLQSYECHNFGYSIWSGAEHGALTLAQDGTYSYIPEDGFTGSDSFSVLISELEGFSDNRNPDQLTADVLDVSDGFPLLARIVTVNVRVGSSGGGAALAEPQNLFIEEHVAYIVGYKDGHIRPQGNLTRAEAATVFFRLLSDEARAANWSRTNQFSDVGDRVWYSNAVSVMSKMGVVSGLSDGRFAPNAPITRAQLAAMVSRFARLMDKQPIKSIQFSDISGHWAEADILYAASIGLFDGGAGAAFRPDDCITRAEFIALVNRMTARAVESADDMLEDMQTWPDNQPGTWYYLDVQEATNSHTHESTEKQVPGRDFNYSRWIAMLPAPNWSALEQDWEKEGT